MSGDTRVWARFLRSIFVTKHSIQRYFSKGKENYAPYRTDLTLLSDEMNKIIKSEDDCKNDETPQQRRHALLLTYRQGEIVRRTIEKESRNRDKYVDLFKTEQRSTFLQEGESMDIDNSQFLQRQHVLIPSGENLALGEVSARVDSEVTLNEIFYDYHG